jgi:hypothetical protein
VVRLSFLATAALALGSACSVGEIDLSGKACPCVQGWTCDVAANRCVQGPLVGDAGDDAAPDAPPDAEPDAQTDAHADADVADSSLPPSDAASELPPAGPDCSVHADQKLYCTNANPSNIYAGPDPSTMLVDQLLHSYDWFTCWVTGTLHAGGNTTWYYTQGDVHGNWGYVPAVDLNTTSQFDSNPTLYGLAHCDQ